MISLKKKFKRLTLIIYITNLVSRRRQWHPTAILLPGKSYGWRSLVGCSPWDREESARAERLHVHFSHSCIGEGNGNPLHCSCLENPRDREPGGLPSMGSHRVEHDVVKASEIISSGKKKKTLKKILSQIIFVKCILSH